MTSGGIYYGIVIWLNLSLAAFKTNIYILKRQVTIYILLHKH